MQHRSIIERERLSWMETCYGEGLNVIGQSHEHAGISKALQLYRGLEWMLMTSDGMAEFAHVLPIQ